MIRLLNLIQTDEFFPLLLLIGLLRMVGIQMAESFPKVRAYARRISGAVFIAYGILASITFTPDGAWDCVLIAVRALLAAGVMLGFSLIAFSAIEMIYQNTAIPYFAERRERIDDERRRVRATEDQRNAEESDRLKAEWQGRLSAAQQASEIKQTEAALKADLAWQAVTDAARDEVVKFYEEFESLLRDSIPRALFRSRIEIGFPKSKKAVEPWKTAQEMIAEMLPCIHEAKQRRRVDEQERRGRSDRARAIQSQIAVFQHEIDSLRNSPVADPEVIQSEVRSLEAEIRRLREELALFEKESLNSMT